MKIRNFMALATLIGITTGCATSPTSPFGSEVWITFNTIIVNEGTTLEPNHSNNPEPMFPESFSRTPLGLRSIYQSFQDARGQGYFALRFGRESSISYRRDQITAFVEKAYCDSPFYAHTEINSNTGKFEPCHQRHDLPIEYSPRQLIDIQQGRSYKFELTRSSQLTFIITSAAQKY